MADAEQQLIIIHNNVIYAIFWVVTKENFNQSYSAPSIIFCTALVLIDRRLFLCRSREGRLRSVCYRRLGHSESDSAVYGFLLALGHFNWGWVGGGGGGDTFGSWVGNITC